MPTISGQVLFNTTNTAPTTGVAITTGVPIALVNTSTNVGLVIKSDSSGNYVFNNVPAGSYKIVEAYGTATTITSPGDFTTAAAVGTIIPADPPITAMPSPPSQANLSQSLTPNTRFVTVAAANITGQNFVDAPVQDIPITKLDISLVGSNSLTGANNGNWGTLPAGTAQGTSPASAPYPANVPGFTFVQPTANAPGDGQYSVLNMSNYSTYNGNWYNTSDHTSRDETGRYFLAGAAGSAIIFTQTISVKSNTYYVFSGWVMNPIQLTGTFIPTQLTITVLGGSGATIYNQSLLSIPNQPVLPIWNESATLFNTGVNTTITFQMLSTGSFGGGNDYIIDDLVIQEANVNTILSSTKTVDKEFAKIGDTLNYTVVLKNTGSSTIQNIAFYDTIPTGTNFLTGTVKINNVGFGALNPTPPGFTLTSPSIIKSGEAVTINFSVLVNTLPSPNPIQNYAISKYYFLPIVGGATVPQTVQSNSANTTVNQAELRSTKQRDLAFVNIGDIITYTIPISNFGTTIANNVILIDTIPNGTSLIEGSIFVNGNQLTTTTPNPPGLNVGSIEANLTTTVAFKVLVTTVPTPNPIQNSGAINYSYIIDPTLARTSTGSALTNIVSSQFNQAFLAASKQVNKIYGNIGDILTYTIPIKNTGNVTANSIVFTDTIPNGTTLQSGSFTQDGTPIAGTPDPPGVALSSIGVGKTSTIVFKVKVDTIPNPNPIPNAANLVFSYTIDPSTVPNRTNLSSSNTNIVNTQVNNANLGNVVKLVDKSFANCGDTITYTIVVPNVGNVTAQNVIFKDTIPNGTNFITDSVYINGNQQLGANPNTGISVPNIDPGSTTTITFSVRVLC